MVGATITNYSILPFQSQDLIGSNISDANQMHAISSSVNYQWLEMANEYIVNQDEIESIVKLVLQGDEDANRETYFEPKHAAPGTPLLPLALNGVHCIMWPHLIRMLTKQRNCSLSMRLAPRRPQLNHQVTRRPRV